MNAREAAEHMELRTDLIQLPLDDELVVFCEDAQRLVGLNAPAALVFRALQRGTSISQLPEIVSREGHLSLQSAERWVATTLDALRSHGMFADQPVVESPTADLTKNLHGVARHVVDMPPFEPFVPASEKHYRLLGTHALIRCVHKDQARAVDAVLGHLATEEEGAPDVLIEVRRVKMADGRLRNDVYRDGKPVAYAPRIHMLGPTVKSILWQSAVNAHDFLFYIHAGVVGTGASCILLPAAAGSGKSSLTAALTHSGFRFYSDEVALIERDSFRVPPMPLAICIKSTGWDLMARYLPELHSMRAHAREDGKIVRYVPPPADTARQAAVPVSHMIFPRYDKDAATEMQPLARSEGLARLMSECLALRARLELATVESLVRWTERIECYSLTFSSLDEAVRLVQQVAGPVKS
jgi:hypothetical protein